MSDIRFYLSLFFRRAHYFLILTVMGAVIGITLAMILPPRYEAQARLVVESEQIPDELAASTVRTEATEQLQIIQQRILSRDKLLDMANRLEIYKARQQSPQTRLRPDEIVEDLRARIDIRTTGGNRRSGDATLVTVSFAAEQPALAASVANEVVTLMLEENVRMRTVVSGQTLDFFEQEVARLDQELSQRGSQIIAFKEENSAALPENLEFRRGQLVAAQERFLQLEREEIALKDRRQRLVDIYASTGQVGAAFGSTEGLTPEQIELRRLEEQYATSVAVMSPQNPRIKVMRAKLEALQQVVANQQAEASGATVNASGETMSAYDIQLADIDDKLEFIAERRSETEEEMKALREAIAATPANTITLQTLERDYENIRQQYDRAVTSKARAETGDMIEALAKGQRISVIEQAVAPLEPTSPNRPKLAAAGIGGGMLAGLALIALMELMNSAIRRPVDISSKLNITPFATLPFIRTKREVMRRRAMIGGVFLIVLLGIPAGLWTIDTYYKPLDLLIEQVKRKIPVTLIQPSMTPEQG